MITTSIAGLALINIFTRLPIQLESESNRTTAVDTCRSILTGAVTASIVDSTRFKAAPPICVHLVLWMAAALWAVSCIFTGVLAPTVPMVTGQNAVSLVLGQLKTRPALTGDTAPWGLLADVTTAVILIHAAQALF